MGSVFHRNYSLSIFFFFKENKQSMLVSTISKYHDKNTGDTWIIREGGHPLTEPNVINLPMQRCCVHLLFIKTFQHVSRGFNEFLFFILLTHQFRLGSAAFLRGKGARATLIPPLNICPEAKVSFRPPQLWQQNTSPNLL